LEIILNETYGVLCYQEDVSKTALALVCFNEADADKLQKGKIANSLLHSELRKRNFLHGVAM
jgi:DNA polymerase III alpha subunit